MFSIEGPRKRVKVEEQAVEGECLTSPLFPFLPQRTQLAVLRSTQLLGAESRLPQNSGVEVLTPSTAVCDRIWKQGFATGMQINCGHWDGS